MEDTGRMTALTGQAGIVPLFATPFAAVNTGVESAFNARLVTLCESQRSKPALPVDAMRDPLHFRSREDLLDSADATAGELRRLILDQSYAVIASLSSLDPASIGKRHMQLRGWCSIVQQNGHVPSQHFPGASWLAMYCVQAGEPGAGPGGAGVLRLYERRLGSIYRDAGNWELKPPYRYGNHTWTPLPGWMALFPAHVPHEVSVVRSATPLVLMFAMIRFG